MFGLRLFGGLSLESATGSVAPSAQQRRRLSLLALLALGGERGMSREKIQAYLWPESAADRARHALDQLLYATRRDLRADVILSSGTDLRLNSSVVRPDIWDFDDAVRAHRWTEAVELYAGPILDGLHLADSAEFERLLDAERARREQDYFSTLELLARQADANGNRSESVRWWRRRAAADPLSSSVAMQLMRALVAAGDRPGAIQHARIYQRLVRDSLDVDPDPAIDRLARELAPARSDLKTSEVAVANPDKSEPVKIEPDARPSHRWPLKYAVLAGAIALVVSVGPFVRSSVLAGSQRGAASPNSQPLDSMPISGQRLTAANRTSDSLARAHYLRGRRSWNKRTKEGLEDAVVQFRSAIERDPTYAAAYTGLADSYAMIGYFGFAPADAMFPKARAAAVQALELDPGAGEAYAALGQALAWQHAWADAEKAYQRSLALSPNDATAHQWYALLLAYIGRAHEAAVHTGHASRLDPLSVQINNMHGMMLYYDGDLRGSLRQYERTVVAEPDSAWVRRNPWVLTNFSRVAAAAGRHDQALRLINRAIEVVPSNPRARFDEAYVYAVSGDPSRARRVFALADSSHSHYAFYRGWLHAVLGEVDEAYVWLDRVEEWALPALVALSNDPSLAKVRTDPRFETIRRRLAMPAR